MDIGVESYQNLSQVHGEAETFLEGWGGMIRNESERVGMIRNGRIRRESSVVKIS